MSSFGPIPRAALGAIASALAAGAPATADVIYNELPQGDLSNNQAAPTLVQLLSGTSTIIGTVSGATDFQDWVTVRVPQGMELWSLVLADYDSLDPVAFIGFQHNPVFDGDPFEAGSYSGYSHFGTAQFEQDLLPLMADQVLNPGSRGFSIPLAAGDYAFLIQQVGEDSFYRLDFIANPVPAPGLLGAGAAAGIWTLRRRR
jgi:hypothetical protein